MTDRRLAGKRARTSGHNFERKVARILKDRFGDRSWCRDIRRTDQSHFAIQPDVAGPPGLWIECQSAQPEKTDPAGKLAQATRDCGKGDVPVAIINRKGGAGSRAILVYLTLASLLKITGVQIPHRAKGQLGSHPLRRKVALRKRPALSERQVSLELGDFLDLYAASPLSSPAMVDDISAPSGHLPGDGERTRATEHWHKTKL